MASRYVHMVPAQFFPGVVPEFVFFFYVRLNGNIS